jgi:hypothetical protein
MFLEIWGFRGKSYEHTIFWDVTPCGLVLSYRRLARYYCHSVDGVDIFLRHNLTYPPCRWFDIFLRHNPTYPPNQKSLVFCFCRNFYRPVKVNERISPKISPVHFFFNIISSFLLTAIRSRRSRLFAILHVVEIYI